MLILAGAALALTTGCISTSTNDGAKVVDVDIEPKSYIANLDVGDVPEEGKATVNCLFGFITWGTRGYADDDSVSTTSGINIFKGGATLAKQAAVFEACEAAEADYLLGTTYRFETEDYLIFKTIKCTATGYPAVVTGVKEATPEVEK